MKLQYFLQEIEKESRYWKVESDFEIAGNPPSLTSPSRYMSHEVFKILKEQRIHGLYLHQSKALKAIQSGYHVVVSTPTASGKSLIYNVAIAEKLLKNKEARSLLIFPIKALSRDQYENARSFFQSIINPENIAVYDGDTEKKEREKIRKNIPNIIITNPDMLHYGFLPYHQKWQKLWENLSFIVIDEMHTYRGVFGSHVAMIVRRLKRICNFYGSSPQFILLSATIGNPEELAAQISGISQKKLVLINNSSAPTPKKHLLFLRTDYPLSLVAAFIAARSIKNGLKTIVFTRSRRMTELVYITLKSKFSNLERFVSSYRSGLLPSDRREIEQSLASGNLKCVVATSALELGVDIGDLDVCVLVGYPGTLMNTWQRAGRVGRSGQESAIIMIPQRDALDQYIVSNPEHILSRHYETAVASTDNLEILKCHLVCAASELPLSKQELDENEAWLKATKELIQHGELWEDESSLLFSSTGYPHRNVDIRQVGKSYTIFLKPKGKDVKPYPLGSIDGVRVFKECHPGAIYLHLGEMYQVTELDLLKRNVVVAPFNGSYFTMAFSEKHTEILEIVSSRPTGNFVIRLGRLRVTERVLGYEKKSTKGAETLDYVDLELPPQSFETVGLWIEIDGWIEKLIKDQKLHFMGGIHAIEHAIISMFPLFLLCDRNDLGGIAIPLHHQIRKSAIFIYDGYPGGVGLSAEAFHIFENILTKVQELLHSCDCIEGCPQCIHSPKCGSGNKPLDKEAAKLISKALLDPQMLAKFGSSSTHTNQQAVPILSSELTAQERELKLAFLDLETQKLAGEVGGWQNKHLMRVSVAVIYDETEKDFLVFRESEIGKLLECLKKYDLIVGFNIKKFDYAVLAPYSTTDLSELPTFDILEEIYRSTGRRVSLDNLSIATLGEGKIANGVEAVRWFRSNNWNNLIEYCKKDVEITRKLFYFAIEKKYLLAVNKGKRVVKISTPWDLNLILKPAPCPTKTKFSL